jgi:hypothetical protein
MNDRDKESAEALAAILKLVRGWQSSTWSEPWVERLDQVEQLAAGALKGSFQLVGATLAAQRNDSAILQRDLPTNNISMQG